MKRPGASYTRKNLNDQDVLDLIAELRTKEVDSKEHIDIRNKLIGMFDKLFENESKNSTHAYLLPSDLREVKLFAFDKAIQTYDANSKFKFSTYFSACERYALFDRLRGVKKIADAEISEVQATGEDGEEVSIFDMIQSETEGIDSVIDDELLYGLVIKTMEQMFTPLEMEIIHDHFDNISVSKLAETYKLTTNEINQILRKFRNSLDKIRKRFEK